VRLRRRIGDAVGAAVLDRVRELVAEINNANDAIRAHTAEIREQTSAEGIGDRNNRDTRPEA
jgi:hypothetical protein